MLKKAEGARDADVTPLHSSVMSRYRQVEAIVRDRIWLGDLRPGDQLPTEQELCRQFAVSRATIRQALQILEQDGLIRKEVARGTFVNSNLEQPRGKLIDLTPASLAMMTMFDQISLKRSGVYLARGEVQNALNVETGTEVFFFLRVFYLNGEPIGGEQVYVPSSLALSISEEDMTHPAIAARLSERAKRGSKRVDLRVSAIAADARHSIRFDTRSGAPLISVLRTSFDDREEPIEHGHMVFRCDRCQLVLSS